MMISVPLDNPLPTPNFERSNFYLAG
jgi:hypothetical protein